MAKAGKRETLAAVKRAAGKRFPKVDKLVAASWQADDPQRNALLGDLLHWAAGLHEQVPDLDELRHDLDRITSCVGDDPTTWDDWDRRIVAAIASSQPCRTSSGVGEWLAYLVTRASPSVDAFGPVAEAMCAHGMTAAELVAVTLSRKGELTRKAATTSFGRYAQPLLHDDLAGVLDAALRLDLVAPVLETLFEQMPAVVTSRLETLALPPNGMGAIAAALLAHDARATAKVATALLASCTDPLPLFAAALALAQAKSKPQAVELGVRAATASGGRGFDIDSKAFVGAKKLGRVLGADVLPIFRAMPRTNGILWRGLLESAANDLGTAAWPYIVEQMLAAAEQQGTVRADPFNAGFRLLGRKGVEAHLAALAPLREHRDGWVAERAASELDALLAKKAKPIAVDPFAARRMPPRKHFDASRGYALEAFAAETARLCLAALLRDKQNIPQPVESLTYWWGDGDLHVQSIAVSDGDTSLSVDVAAPKRSRVPRHVDDATGKTSPLAELWKLIGVAAEPAFETMSWGNSHELPLAAHYYELLTAAATIVEGLATANIAVAKKVKLAIADDSDEARIYGTAARAHLATFPSDLRADIAAVLYATPARRAWLLHARSRAKR